MKFGTKSIFIVFFILSILVLILAFSTPRWKLSSGATITSIRAVKLGMSKSEVKKLLGEPLSVESKNTGYETDRETLRFSEAVPISKWYPMLWVHFENDKVVVVYAKRYEWFDEKGIYGLTKDRAWETELFSKSFPAE